MHHHSNTILALAAAGVLGFSSLAFAQPPAPPPAPSAQTMPGTMRGPMPGALRGPMAGAMPGPHHWAQGDHWRGHDWRQRAHARDAFIRHMKTWGLFERPADLALSPTDVQTIAEAILLRHGEHSWKVGDVTANADHTVSFAFLTEHGDVIARFTMNTVTGRITRTN